MNGRRWSWFVPLLLLAPSGWAQQQAWVVKFGVHEVNPKSDNGRLADGAFKTSVDSSTRPTATLEYLFGHGWGVEAIAAWPFRHEIRLNGARAASAQQLPPIVSLQYHFDTHTDWSPFIGAGVNYTRFFSVRETGPLRGGRLALGDSWGPALHAGVEWRLDPRWLLSVDLRWVDIDSKVKLDGAHLGTAHIDPWVYGLAVGYRF